MKFKLELTKPQSLVLLNDIANYIDSVDNLKVLAPDVKCNMARSLAIFAEHAIEKFIKGQKEHGGYIRDRDLMAELYAEQIDSFWYGPHGAMSWTIKQEDK